jgi:ferrochelatase
MTEPQTSNAGQKRWGVLLLAHGAPDRLADIPDFLLYVRGGRKLPDAAVKEITERYAKVGGGSPLLALTNRQAESLAAFLNRGHRTGGIPKADAPPVYVGMRNWKPFIAESVRRMAQDKVEAVVAICLAPQNSRTSIGLYRGDLQDAVGRLAPSMHVEFVESWHDHPCLVAAFREKAEQTLARAQAAAGGRVPVVFTAHSVPEHSIASGDPYQRQVLETAALVARAVGLDDYRVAFQSQGMTPEPWIGPTVNSLIDEFAAAGHRHVLLVPVGFIADHIEILYDIDVAFRDYGNARGVTVWRSESLNDSPLLIEALGAIVVERMKQVEGRRQAG